MDNGGADSLCWNNLTASVQFILNLGNITCGYTLSITGFLPTFSKQIWTKYRTPCTTTEMQMKEIDIKQLCQIQIE